MSLIFCLLLGLSGQADWSLPNLPASGIGDFGSFYLANDQDISLHVINDDYIGNTDKLMTGSMDLYYYQKLNDTSGWNASINRRLLTPILETNFGQPRLTPAPGVYADWFEAQWGYSSVLNNWKFELGLNYNDFGNFGGYSMQSGIHRILKTGDQSSLYGSELVSSSAGIGGGIGYLINPNILVMLYQKNDAVMNETILRTSVVKNLNQVYFGLQFSYIWQNYSNLYGPTILPLRYELSGSIRYSWWQLNYGYVSTYLNYDHFGQCYIDPLIINF